MSGLHSMAASAFVAGETSIDVHPPRPGSDGDTVPHVLVLGGDTYPYLNLYFRDVADLARLRDAITAALDQPL